MALTQKTKADSPVETPIQNETISPTAEPSPIHVNAPNVSDVESEAIADGNAHSLTPDTSEEPPSLSGKSLFEQGKLLIEKHQGKWQDQSVNQVARTLLEEERLPLFKDLLGSSELHKNHNWAYFQAGAFVRYLSHSSPTKEKRHEAYNQIRHLRTPEDITRFDTVLKELRGKSFSQLEQDWRCYIRDYAWMQVLIEAQHILVDPKVKDFYQWHKKHAATGLVNSSGLKAFETLMGASKKIEIMANPQIMAQVTKLQK